MRQKHEAEVAAVEKAKVRRAMSVTNCDMCRCRFDDQAAEAKAKAKAKFKMKAKAKPKAKAQEEKLSRVPRVGGGNLQ